MFSGLKELRVADGVRENFVIGAEPVATQLETERHCRQLTLVLASRKFILGAAK